MFTGNHQLLGGSITVKKIEDLAQEILRVFKKMNPCYDDLDFKLPLLIAASSLAFQPIYFSEVS